MAEAYSSATQHSPHPWARVPVGALARPWLPVAAIALLAALWGVAVALLDVNALYLCLALIGCLFVLYDFRIGVVLLIVLLPVSGSTMLPRAMFGVTGLNPLNLLLVGTLASWLLQALGDGSLRRFLPARLFWLYVLPIIIAGLIGSQYVDEIALTFYMTDQVHFDTPTGYFMEMVVKPLLLVVFALLVAAAVARSKRPEKFLVPTVIAVWVMVAVIVGFIIRSGVGLGELSSSTAREFLNPLGLHANDLGRLYATAYALMLFSWAGARGAGLKLVLLVSMGLATLALVLTFSRGAFLGFIVINALFVLWRMEAKTVVFVGVLGLCALFALPGVVYQRATTGFGEGLNAITAGRYEGLWLPLLPEFERSPLWGNGIGAMLWSEAMRNADGYNVLATTHPHNAYLHTVLDMGLVGLVLVCAYFFHVWKGFRRLGADPDLAPQLRGFFQGGAAALVSLAVAGISDGAFTPRLEQFYLWLAIGVMYGQLARGKVN